ncbi:4'-phosphopantetheinyl transferase family protein [Actinomadura macrotermitis]|uniref:4'-phosphopantetheinyl transferase Npt n=1 Tax=Actinomadura macrotermitis TaxID=2585200 RepID=A0A7K0C9C1_9ACTN|nr:4'-phosphopantetheinyl transferase superfamily protein [Actinomadura macrotermitis]MQY09712.1 4'-phosphopantetheinyl transferase Npt [Actinomadura macrotermitis]
MIERIVPEAVVAVEAFGDARTDTWLFPEERAVIARAVDKRRREFTAARGCAHDAMAKLGVPAAPLLPGERGAPAWPAGVNGSITHCAGYHAAAVASAGEVAALGIDAEPHAPLPGGVLDAIALPGEAARLRNLSAADPSISWDRLLFSAKESVYKTWFPLTGRPLAFEGADLAFERDGTFTARILVPGVPAVLGPPLRGRWLVGAGLAMTAIAVPTPVPTPSPKETTHDGRR